MKNCPKCNTEHDKKGIFCSHSCANSRMHSEETKRKIGNGVKTYCDNNPFKVREVTLTRMEKHRKAPVVKICKECGKEYCNSNIMYCSRECSLKNSGGYRNHSGRSKSGYYNGMYCGSTYELVWVIYCSDHNIKFSRFEGVLTDGVLTYIPDFIIDNKIIEIKGYENREAVLKKCELSERLGYTIEVLYKDDLKHMFEYVETTYNTKKFETLYDEYKPKYQYMCSSCKTSYSSDVKKKTVVNYCSRICSGKGKNIN